MGEEAAARRDVSIIVPTFNRCKQLRRLLQTLSAEATTGLEFEVIVVVDGSNDGTAEMLDALATPYPLRVCTQANAGPAAARNRGVRAAEGDLLLFLDDDVLPEPGIVAAHQRHHVDAMDLVVIGPMLPPPIRLTPWLAWEAAMLRKQYAAMLSGLYPPTPRQFYTGNASVRRALVLAVGGFDERYTRAEDVELAYRLQRNGAHFLFDPRAAVTHQPDRTLRGWRRVGYDYGRFDALMTYDGGVSPLAISVREWPRRHTLARGLAHLCVGRRARMAALRGALPLLLHGSEALGLDRVGQLACSAVFNVEYWQGVADATGTGSRIWERFESLGRPPARLPRATSSVPLEPAGSREP